MIYFLRFEDKVKIGYSKDYAGVKKRFTSMKTSFSSSDYMLIGVIYGEKDEESYLHSKFSYLNTHGEWFLLNYELKDYIFNNRGLHKFEKIDKDPLYDGIFDNYKCPNCHGVLLEDMYCYYCENCAYMFNIYYLNM